MISKSIFGADDIADNGGRPSLLSIKEILVDWFEVQQMRDQDIGGASLVDWVPLWH